MNGAGGYFVTEILAILQHRFWLFSYIGYCACEGREKRREQFLIMKKERKTAEREKERESLLPARSLLPAAAVSVGRLFF